MVVAIYLARLLARWMVGSHWLLLFHQLREVQPDISRLVSCGSEVCDVKGPTTSKEGRCSDSMKFKIVRISCEGYYIFP